MGTCLACPPPVSGDGLTDIRLILPHVKTPTTERRSSSPPPLGRDGHVTCGPRGSTYSPLGDHLCRRCTTLLQEVRRSVHSIKPPVGAPDPTRGPGTRMWSIQTRDCQSRPAWRPTHTDRVGNPTCQCSSARLRGQTLLVQGGHVPLGPGRGLAAPGRSQLTRPSHGQEEARRLRPLLLTRMAGPQPRTATDGDSDASPTRCSANQAPEARTTSAAPLER